MTTLQKFTEFLETINLLNLKEKYSKYKLIEMDMYLSGYKKYNVLKTIIQPIELIYKIYWIERKFIYFDDFFKIYYKEKKKWLELFRRQIQLSIDCVEFKKLDDKTLKTIFKIGLKARVYRIWLGLITQIHAGYVLESIVGKNNVEMSRELDSEGIDIKCNYKNHILYYQIKIKSMSEFSGRNISIRNDKSIIQIRYEVPNRKDILDNPKLKNGKFRTSYLKFMKDKTTKMLSNGFLVFTKEMFLSDISKINLDLKNN